MLRLNIGAGFGALVLNISAVGACFLFRQMVASLHCQEIRVDVQVLLLKIITLRCLGSDVWLIFLSTSASGKPFASRCGSTNLRLYGRGRNRFHLLEI